MNDTELILNKLLDYYKIDTMSELSELLEVSQPTISKWKARNSITPIKKKCRELGIYNEIFGDLNSKNISNSSQNLNIDDNIINLVNTIYGFAKDKNRIDEFKSDLSLLLKKYI